MLKEKAADFDEKSVWILIRSGLTCLNLLTLRVTISLALFCASAAAGVMRFYRVHLGVDLGTVIVF